MKQMEAIIAKRDWEKVGDNLHERGFSVLPQFVDHQLCDDLKNLYARESGYRKTVVMERHRFGLGEYKYFDYPLPESIQALRDGIYPRLVPIANMWMKALKTGKEFPGSLEELQGQCWEQNQRKPTPLLLRYGKGGFNTLHQDLYGEVYFPLQAVLFLNEPDVDFTGGEFVLTQQIPRAQSRAIVLRPKKGDLLVFTTNFRPVKGERGYYRVTMKHGVSELHSGERHTLGIIFHDAVS